MSLFFFGVGKLECGKEISCNPTKSNSFVAAGGFFSYEAENTKTCVPLHRSMRTALLVERPPITLAGCVLWLAFDVLRGTNRRRGLLHR
jgi:hypothetical protein